MSEQTCLGCSQINFMMNVMTSKQAVTRVTSCDDAVEFFKKNLRVVLIYE